MSFIEEVLKANKKNIPEIVKFIQGLDRGGNCRLITGSMQEVLKKGGRNSGKPVPANYQGLGKFTNNVVGIGYDYDSIMVRNGADMEVYDSIKDKTREPWSIPHTKYASLKNIIRTHRTKEGEYIRVFPGISFKDITVTLVDASGKPIEVAKEEKEDFFSPKPAPMHVSTLTQSASGCTKNPDPRDYHAEDILYLQKGKDVINFLGKELMDLLDLEYVE